MQAFEPHAATRKAQLAVQDLVYCVLVHFFVHPPAASGTTGQPFQSSRLKKDVACVLLSDLTCEDRLVHPTLTQLYASLAQRLGEAGQELVRQVHTVLQGLTTPDGLYRLFDALEVLLISSSSGPQSAAGVHVDSPLGLLLRRCRVSFRLMPFEDVIRLHADVEACVAAVGPQALAPSPALAPGEERGDPQPAGGGASLLLSRLRPDIAVHAVLARRLQQLETGKTTHGNPKPSRGGQATDPEGPPTATVAADGAEPARCDAHEEREVEGVLASMGVPGAMLLQLTEALRDHDYTAAVEGLHRYYDHAQDSAAGPGPGSSTMGSRGRYQHSLLGVSELHAGFGHTQEALRSLSEALCMAQQAGDAACLANCLACLQRVMVEAPGAPGLPGLGLGASRQLDYHQTLTALLHSCLERGQALHMPHLVAFARLGLVRCAMQRSPVPHGAGGQSGAKSSSPAQPCFQIQASRALRDMCLLHHAAGLDAMSGTVAQRPPKGSPPALTAPTDLYSEPAVHVLPSSADAKAHTRALLQAAGCSHLLCSHAWISASSPTLAHLHATTFLACYGASSPASDVDLARALLLGLVRDKQGLDAAAAFCPAADAGLWSPEDPGASSGTSAGAPPSCSKQLMAAQLTHGIERALAQGQLHEAEWLLHSMADLAAPAPLDTAIRAAVFQQQSVICKAAGRLSEAHDAASQLFCLASHVGMQAEALQALLLLGRVHAAAGNWATSLLHVLSCLLHACLLSHDALAAEACTDLVEVWHRLCPSATFELRQVLQELLPLVLASGPTTQRHMTLALANSLAGNSDRTLGSV